MTIADITEPSLGMTFDLENSVDIFVDNLTDLNGTAWRNWTETIHDSVTSKAYSTWQIVVLATLAGITSLVTIGGNLIVIISFIVERSIRQPTNYFIASLAVSDLLIGSVSMPFYTVYLLAGQRWPLGEILCDLWLSIDYTVCLCSIYTVFCITIDRFCSVKIPATYREWRTENKVTIMVTVTWAIPVFVFFTSIFGWQYFVGQRTVPEGKCYVQYMEAALFNCLLQVGYFWITLTVMCILYTGIYQVVLTLSRKSEEKQKKLTTMSTFKGPTTSDNHLKPPDQLDPGGRDEDEKQIQRRCSSNSAAAAAVTDGSDSDLSQSPIATRKIRKIKMKSTNQDLSKFSNGKGHHSSKLRQALFGEKKTKDYNKHQQQSARHVIMVDDVNDDDIDVDPTVGINLLPYSGNVVQCYDSIVDQGTTTNNSNIIPICKLDIIDDAEDKCRSSYNNQQNDTLSTDAQQIHKKSTYSSCESDVKGLTINAKSSERLTVQPMHVSRKSSSISISSRRFSRSPSDTKFPGRHRGSSQNLLMRQKSSNQSTKFKSKRKTNSSENRARKALRTITVILGAFVLCWTPWHILSMIISLCPSDKVCVEPVLYDISYWLCYLNSPINPLCYALANQQFKKTFIRIIKLDFHRA